MEEGWTQPGPRLRGLSRGNKYGSRGAVGVGVHGQGKWLIGCRAQPNARCLGFPFCRLGTRPSLVFRPLS